MTNEITSVPADGISHLSDLVNLTNLFTAGLAASLMLFFQHCVKKCRDCRDSKRIHEFLKKHQAATDQEFNNTYFISSRTKIPEQRVAELCSKHKNIRRNEEKKEMWTLVD
jgi:hypothetical protein